MNHDTAILRGRTSWQSTPWTLLLEQRDPGWRDEFARRYWRPVYAYFRRSWRVHDVEEAKDLTQEFFLHLMKRGALDEVAPQRGRLRSFLRACADNFIRQALRSRAAWKRGGRMHRTPLEEVEPVAADDRDSGFDREWRRALVEGALEEMDRDLRGEGRGEEMDLFRAVADGGGETHRTLAERLGWTERRMEGALRRLRGEYRARLIGRLRETVASADELAQELSILFGTKS